MQNEDYVVRYGGDTLSTVRRSDYLNEQDAKNLYSKIQLNTEVTWKELLFEPLEFPDVQQIIRSESARVVNLGPFGRIAMPE